MSDQTKILKYSVAWSTEVDSPIRIIVHPAEPGPENQGHEEISQDLNVGEVDTDRLQVPNSPTENMPSNLDLQSQTEQPTEPTVEHQGSEISPDVGKATEIVDDELRILNTTTTDNPSNIPNNYDLESRPEPEQSNSIDIEPGEAESTETTTLSQTPTHLHTYLQFMYAIGVSVYVKENRPRRGRGHFILCTLQKVLFFLLSSLAFIKAVDNLKYFYLLFVEKRKLPDYLRFGWNVLHSLSAIYFVKFVAFESKKISSMLESLQQWNCELRKTRFNVLMTHLPVLLGTTSLICAVITAVISFSTFQGLLTGKTYLMQSLSISHTFFVWKAQNLSQQEDRLYNNYGQEFTPATIILGFLGTLMDFGGALQQNVIRDIMLLAALSLYKCVRNFEEYLATASTMEQSQNILNLDEHWKKFKILQHTSKTMANALGTLLAFLHVKNLILFSMFLLDALGKSEIRMGTLMTLLGILKTSATYVIAIKASHINQTFRTWIHERRNNREEFYIGGVEISGTMILDEVKSEPVGLGRGMSFVTISFITKFLGYAVSCFMFFAKEED